MKVMKFGGTSVGSIESLLNLRDIVNAEQQPVVVVVSAMGGFTNQLLAMCEQAQQRDISCLDTLEAARQRHHEAIDGVVIESMRDQVHATIDRFIDESLKPYYLALATNPHMPVDEIERVCDAIVAHGEILSSAIVTGMFEEGVPHLSLNFMRTVPDGAGRVLDWQETERLVKDDFASMDGGVHVAQGFISRDKATGAVTNLGRGGSDYTVYDGRPAHPSRCHRHSADDLRAGPGHVRCGRQGHLPAHHCPRGDETHSRLGQEHVQSPGSGHRYRELMTSD